MGTSIHDVAQTTGAGVMYKQQFGGEQALNAAVIVKLMRNVMMAAGVNRHDSRPYAEASSTRTPSPTTPSAPRNASFMRQRRRT